MHWFFAEAGSGTLVGASFVVGMIAGGSANLWSLALCETDPRQAAGGDRVDGSSRWYQLLPIVGRFLSAGAVSGGQTRFRGRPVGWRGFSVEVATGLLFAAYVVAAVRLNCQQISEVRPDEFWTDVRVLYHLMLLTLLVAATAIDIRECVIPDQITVPGMVLGLAGAIVSGQLQMVHVWVDWNQEIPGIAGPYLPAWLDTHRHLHGLAWSAAGGLVGAGLTWFVRGLSSYILKREALGFGDVTLMAMIGTFIGWQPIVFVFALAPICGLAFSLPLRALTGAEHVPYGPFLAAATVIVLFTWRHLWLSTRLIFGHPQSLGLLALAAAGGLALLLCGVRFYRSR